MQKIFYSDGGCRPTNPGPGGFGWIEIQDNKVVDYNSDYFSNTTNNRMELLAILDIFKEKIEPNRIACSFQDIPMTNFIIYSDSAYCVNIINQWMQSWARNGWTRAKGKPIENLDLVKEIYKYYNKNIWNVQVEKCKGHCGDVYNDLVDALTWSEEKFRELAKSKNVDIL